MLLSYIATKMWFQFLWFHLFWCLKNGARYAGVSPDITSYNTKTIVRVNIVFTFTNQIDYVYDGDTVYVTDR